VRRYLQDHGRILHAALVITLGIGISSNGADDLRKALAYHSSGNLDMSENEAPARLGSCRLRSLNGRAHLTPVVSGLFQRHFFPRPR